MTKNFREGERYRVYYSTIAVDSVSARCYNRLNINQQIITFHSFFKPESRSNKANASIIDNNNTSEK